MSPKQAIRNLESLKASLKEETRKAVWRTARHALVVAHRLASGTASYKQLRLEDYPYATRHGSPLRNPTIVNRHSGKFYQSLTLMEHSGGVLLFADEDVAPYSKFLETGTKGRVVGFANEAVIGNKGTWSRRVSIYRGGMFSRISFMDDIIFEVREEYVLNLLQARLTWETKANSYI